VKYSIAPAAADDIDEAVAFYIRGNRSVAVRFIDAVYSAIALLFRNPCLGAPIDSDFRRFPLQRYPFSLIYQVDKKRREIMIYAVMHQGRRPGSWHNRVQESAPLYAAA